MNPLIKLNIDIAKARGYYNPQEHSIMDVCYEKENGLIDQVPLWVFDDAIAMELFYELPEPKRIHVHDKTHPYPRKFTVISGGGCEEATGCFDGFVHLGIGDSIAHAISACWLDWHKDPRNTK